MSALTAQEVDLGAPLLVAVTALLTELIGILAQSESSGSENLQFELFLHLLKFAERFPHEPEKLALYVQQSLRCKTGCGGGERGDTPADPVTANRGVRYLITRHG